MTGASDMADISDLLDEFDEFCDLFLDDLKDSDGISIPCAQSYGRGRCEKSRSLPRLPKSAPDLSMKLKAEKPWLEYREFDDVKQDPHNSIEMLVKEAISLTQTPRKVTVPRSQRGRGRAKVLSGRPDLYQLPGGLTQRDMSASQPKLTPHILSSGLVGNFSDYAAKWEDANTLSRPISVPNINTAVEFESEFPPLMPGKKTTKKQKINVDIPIEPPEPFPMKKRLPTKKDYHNYLERMEKKRMRCLNRDPGVYESSELPPPDYEIMKGDGLVINVIPEKLKKSGQKNGDSITTSQANLTENRIILKPAEEFDRSSESSIFNLDSLEVSTDSVRSDIQDTEKCEPTTVLSDYKWRALQFHLNSAESHNKRLDKKLNMNANETRSFQNDKKSGSHLCVCSKEICVCDGHSMNSEDKNIPCLPNGGIDDTLCDSSYLHFEPFSASASISSQSDIHNSLSLSANNIPTCKQMENESNLDVANYRLSKPNLLHSSLDSLTPNELSCSTSSASSAQPSSSSSYLTVASSTSSVGVSHTEHNVQCTWARSEGFTVVLDWKLHGRHVIQLEGLPLDADLSVVEELLASIGCIHSREVKRAENQKFARYKLDSEDSCDFAVECLHDTDCLFPESNSVLECSRV